MQRRLIYIGLFAACVVSRLLTTIYYIEDTDSLRFALSVYDEFDVASLQPHFPGSPVFWAAARLFYWMTGSFAFAFSLVGGLATFAVVYFCVRLAGRDPLSPDGLAIAFLLFFNPMIWLMGNRYMPDLMGLGLALAALASLTAVKPLGAPAALPALSASTSLRTGILAGSFNGLLAGILTGLLAGTRLSYVPLLLPAYLMRLRRQPLQLTAWTLLGTAIWFIPMLADTGRDALVTSASQQTEGHFTEFGGTVETNPNLLVRTTRVAEGVWADGYGAWWPDRHWLTAVVAAGLTAAAMAAVIAAAVSHSDSRSTSTRPRSPSTRPRSPSASDSRSPSTRPRSPSTRHRPFRQASSASHLSSSPSLASSSSSEPAARPKLLLVSVLTYALWIFLFQNVIYKSRHVLPLVALAAIPIGIGLARLARGPRLAARGAAGVFAVAYIAVMLVIVTQHREPTAIAQIKEHVQDARPAYIASIPLVNFYLSRQGVEATYLSVHDQADRERLGDVKGKLIVIGRYPEIMPPDPVAVDTFYHNPYVNRMWSEVVAHVYDR
jgi:hypothetical protein